VDGQLPSEIRQGMTAHLALCARCRHKNRNLAEVRAAMRGMPARDAPANLTTRLRVVASRERAYRTMTWWQRKHEQFRMWVDHLMRPFAIPAFGGVTSAIVLFCILAPSLAIRGNAESSFDVPTALYTEPTVYKVSPLGFESEDLLEVDLTIDDTGRMVDYTIPTGQHDVAKDASLRRSLENHLLTTQFIPATAFGQRTGAKIRLTFRNQRMQIDVKG
jgi:hypothetical protein